MNNLLNLSGGGTKIIGIYAAAKNILKRGYKPSIISGVSAGAYLSLPLALGYFDKIDLMLNKLTLDTMFDPKPINEKGNITIASIWRIVKGKYYIGDQTKSLDLLRAAVSSGDFDEWKYNENNIYPECYVSAVDFKSGSKELISLRDCNYENALSFVLASGSIPFYTKGVEIVYQSKNKLLFDGGLRNHIASVSVLQSELSKKNKIDRSISIFARPEDYKIIESEDWMPADVSTVIQRTLDIMGIEISKKDEEMEKMICINNNIEVDQIFLPDVMQGTYDVDRDRLKKYAELSSLEASKIII